jgi:hypothetical protein
MDLPGISVDFGGNQLFIQSIEALGLNNIDPPPLYHRQHGRVGIGFSIGENMVLHKFGIVSGRTPIKIILVLSPMRPLVSLHSR